MNWKLLAGGAFLLFAAGYGAGTCGKPSSAELNASRDSTKAAVAFARRAEDARAATEVRSRTEILVHQARADSALAVARAAANRRPTVVDRIVLREAPADTLVARRVAVAVTDSLVQHEIQPRDVALTAKDSVIVSQSRLLAATNAALLAAQNGMRVQALEITALRDARPSWFARHGVPAIKLVLVGAAAYEVGRATK